MIVDGRRLGPRQDRYCRALQGVRKAIFGSNRPTLGGSAKGAAHGAAEEPADAL